ncbi:hypothetical protein D3C81_2230810 [compost metagenome]
MDACMPVGITTATIAQALQGAGQAGVAQQARMQVMRQPANIPRDLKQLLLKLLDLSQRGCRRGSFQGAELDRDGRQ